MGGLFLGEGPKFLVAVQKNLVLISVAGEDVFDQRFRPVQTDGVLIETAVHGGKDRGKEAASVLQSKPFVELFCGQDNAAVEFPDQAADLLLDRKSVV